MNPRNLLVIVMLLCAAYAKAAEPIASDDAAQDVYSSDWAGSGGTGFGDWKFKDSNAGGESYSGHYIATTSNNPGIDSVAVDGKAFGLFANGTAFEASCAFRPFSAPLQAGDSFSFQLKNVPIDQKGQNDVPDAGSIGLTLREGNMADAAEDYNKGARFEIANLKGQANYQIYDGEANHDSGVPYSEEGITVKITLASADSYDLEITSEGKTTKLSGRKLGDSGPVESFCIYNRNGEKADAFFNSFQVRKAD